jgi:hypothetical protein
MKSEVVGHLQLSTKKNVKDGASQFPNFLVNFHKFHALFLAIFSQLGWLGYRRFCVRLVSKMLKERPKRRNGFRFDLLWR